jgi:REP element-mobilizing transposase RayT
MDRLLDKVEHGHAWLRRPDLAQLVVDAIRYVEEGLHLCLVQSFAVMPNHVHLLMTPQVPVPRILQCLKGYTAREANKRLGRGGEAFWQSESYDHWVRSRDEFNRIVRYIETNPVKAGLAREPAEYQWSSAGKGSG